MVQHAHSPVRSQKSHSARAALPAGLYFDSAWARQVFNLGPRLKPLVLSEENLCGYPHNGVLHGLVGPETAQRLHAIMTDARIVIFIRNQASLLRAAYAQ